MKIDEKNSFDLTTDSLCIRANAVPWDTDIFGFPVAAISAIEVKERVGAQVPFNSFKGWVREHAFEIVSCRLQHQEIEASMFLERNGFRFVEMVLHPVVASLQNYPVTDTGLLVEEVCEKELPAVVSMAERSFGFERYHIDPRLDPKLADIRYGRWVRNSFLDSKQVLLKIMSAERETVGFFVVENKEDGTTYWHLTAVNPDCQGRKLGHRIWMTMIGYHMAAGREGIRTTIAARNTPVLNLYSKLDFRFAPPEMTFHWVNSDQ